MAPQITRRGETIDTGKAGFVKIPIEEMKVGHAGLYHDDEDENTPAPVNTSDDDNDGVIEDIPLLERTGGNTVINSEKGVKAFVKTLSKDKDNHLPNTETGVWVYYLTQGIRRDYKRTWEEAPKSIAERIPVTKKSREKAKRIMTKAQKNELLKQMEMKYYEDKIATGEITLEDAFASMKEAFNKKKDIEEAGYFLSPNKTDAVQLFDWKGIVNNAHEDQLAWRLYSSNKLSIIIPNILENYYNDEHKPQKLINEMMKCRMLLATCYKDDRTDSLGGNTVEMSVEGVDTDIKNDKMLWKLVAALAPNLTKEISKTHTIVGYHLVQRRTSGDMKPRYLAIDTIKKSTKSHEVFIPDSDGSIHTIRK